MNDITKERKITISKIVLAAPFIVAVGVALAGYFIGDGIVKNKTADRYVTVRGTAEVEVEADFAVWNLKFVNAGNDLQTLLQKSTNDQKLVIDFFTKNGISQDEYEITSYDVMDMQTQIYRNSNENQNRYIVSQNIMITSNDTKKIAATSSQLSDLLNSGVIFDDQGGNSPQYYYTSLNSIKPKMIEDATKNARESAEQFAKDSGAKVGQIRTASQGLFSINAIGDTGNWQYEMRQRKKQVRVVNTIQFYLN